MLFSRLGKGSVIGKGALLGFNWPLLQTFADHICLELLHHVSRMRSEGLWLISRCFGCRMCVGRGDFTIEIPCNSFNHRCQTPPSSEGWPGWDHNTEIYNDYPYFQEVNTSDNISESKLDSTPNHRHYEEFMAFTNEIDTSFSDQLLWQSNGKNMV